MVESYVPALAELSFRQSLLADPATMAYNHAWGGTIEFPASRWPEWYDQWVARPQGRRFYRYLRVGGTFVGEIAWHWDEARRLHLADVIVLARFRGNGYGRAGLQLLCQAAREAGIERLYDDIAADNPAIGLFLSEGFVEEFRTDEIIMLKKTL